MGGSFVSLESVGRYASRRVHEESGGAQTPVCDGPASDYALAHVPDQPFGLILPAGATDNCSYFLILARPGVATVARAREVDATGACVSEHLTWQVPETSAWTIHIPLQTTCSCVTALQISLEDLRGHVLHARTVAMRRAYVPHW